MNYNNKPKDPVALNLFLKDLIEAIEKAERRIKREKRKENYKKINKLMREIYRHGNLKVLTKQFLEVFIK